LSISAFSTELAELTYYWPRQKKIKRVHFSIIFSTSVTLPHFINGPFEIPEQLAVEKTLESKRIHKRV